MNSVIIFKIQFTFIITMLTSVFLGCKNIMITNQSNARIITKQLAIDFRFYPEESIIVNDSLFVFGDSFLHEGLFAKYLLKGDKLILIEESKDYNITSIGIEYKDSIYSTSKNKNYYKGQVISNNESYYLGIDRVNRNEPNILLADIENHGTFFLSKDGCQTWRIIEELNNFNSIGHGGVRWTIRKDSIIYILGSDNGFKFENFSIFKYNLFNGNVSKTSIKPMKGEYPEFTILNDVPALFSEFENKKGIYIYDLDSLFYSEEKIKAPSGRKIHDIYQTDEFDIIVTTTIKSGHGPGRYQIFSKKHDSKKWTLDASLPHFVAYSFSNGQLVGFGLDNYFYKLIWS